MKRRAVAKIFAMIILASCTLKPMTALAGQTLANENRHKDTADYCISASDVSITMSEMAGMTDEELYAFIEKEANYRFRIWLQDLAPLTDGYSTDFSAVKREPTTDGYPVTVTLPPINPNVVSDITYKVFVTDDSMEKPDFSKHTVAEGYERHIDADPICISYNDITVDINDVQLWLDNGSVNQELTQRFSFQAWNYESDSAVTVQASVSIDRLLAEAGQYEAKGAFTLDEGTTLDAPLTVYVTGTKPVPYYTMTVRYLNAESGEELAPAYVSEQEAGSDYDLSQPTKFALNGYEQGEVVGSVKGQLTGDLEIIVYYTKIQSPPSPPPITEPDYDYYRVTVYYIDTTTGENLQTSYQSQSIREGRRYDVESKITELDGYRLLRVEGETTGIIRDNITITAYYQKVPLYYSITIHYIDSNTGIELLPMYQNVELAENSDYDVTALVIREIEGYLYKESTGVLSGQITCDINICSYFEKEQEVVPKPVETDPTQPSDSATPPGSTTPAQPTEPAGAVQEEPPTDTPTDSTPPVSENPALPDSPNRPSGGDGQDQLPVTENTSEDIAQNSETDIESIGQTEKKGDVGIVSMLLMSIGTLTAAALGGSIISDLQVLKWYDQKKQRKVIL